ncbi:MAG TPA: HisA/HisF-related TIM barrel protein [Gemmatimonadales bacterium]|nr:HisA/HisF-related TIM barrel protein [Gemmatimonadales bacterium]
MAGAEAAMRVIPVLDLMAGQAVHARRGRRAAYPPARSVLVPADRAGDPLALARAFHETLRADEWYVADLDALTGAAPQRGLLRVLAGLGGRLLVDAATVTPARARDTLADGAARVVVGLETLPSFAALGRIAEAIGRAHLVFSLDLRAGRPVLQAGTRHHGTPLALARAALDAGAAALLVLDLARVGRGCGVNLELVAAVRRAHPGVELLAGGGIRSVGDLERLAAVGCDGALVATALHEGGLTREHLEEVRRRPDRRRAGHARDSR